jgi:hypothetical protein
MENLIQNKIEDFKNTFFKSLNSTINLSVKCEVCERNTFISLCLAKEMVGVSYI